MASWSWDEFMVWVNVGSPMDPGVAQLYLNRDTLYTLVELNASLLADIDRLPNLTLLNLSTTGLDSIPTEIFKLRNLEHLIIENNFIRSIPPEIGLLQNLTELSMNNNRLTTLPPEIGQLHNLRRLWISMNMIEVLPPEIGQLQNLRTLSAFNNELTTLPGELGQLRYLETFDVGQNHIRVIPAEFGQLQALTQMTFWNNPIEHVPMNIVRLLARQRVVARGVYGDAQSVHTTSIQTSIQESIIRLLNTPHPEKDVVPLIIADPVLTPFAKESLLEYSKDETVHSILNMTFSDVLLVVWNRILVSSHGDEIKAVLNTEMEDAACKCFTGRISRLVNCLNGFDDLVQIQIMDSEQIGSIISHIKTQLEEAGEYTIERHKTLSRQRLTELNVPDDEITTWLEYIE